MFSGIVYLELFVLLFFLPGFFITVILGIKKFRFLLSFALSYSLLVLTILPFEYYAQPIASWQWCVLLEWVLLAVLAVIKVVIDGNSKTSNPAFRGASACPAEGGIQRSTLNARFRTNRFGFNVGSWKLNVQSWSDLILRLLGLRLLIPLALAGVICGYLAYAGVYLEIPADAWAHVARFQFQQLSAMDLGCFPSGVSFKNLFLTENPFRYVIHWYFIHAWLCHVSGLKIMDSLAVLTLVNTLVFSLGFYYFGLDLFAGLRVSVLKKMMMAALSSLFASAAMGFMVFAYIRYYVFAPAILNYVLFLAAMALIIAWLRSNRWLGHALWIAPVLLLVASLIHPQESLFIFFMTLALSIVEAISVFWQHTEAVKILPTPASGHPSKGGELILIPSGEGQGWVDNHWSARKYKAIILAAALLLVFFAGFAVMRHIKPGSWVSPQMIMPRVSLPPESVNFIFQKLMISPPVNPYFRLAAYQLFVFYQVLGCWGLFVYLLFVLQFRQFVKLPYLTAGLFVVPLLTAFNPLTVDMLVRMGQDPVLYRFHYLIPLPFVAGCLFVHFWGRMREWLRRMRLSPAKSVSPIWPRLSWINFTGCMLILAGLIGLLWPINGAGLYAPYSKIYSLRKIPAGNDCHLWEDLGRVMEQFENKIILTDCLTRFMTCYALHNNNCLYSEWLHSRNPEQDPPKPYTWEALRGRGVIIVNRRDGAPSLTGKISRHWPEDVLHVSRYYSPEAQRYLEAHPEIFQKIWARNRIAIYTVR